jgi:hypothetical protein
MANSLFLPISSPLFGLGRISFGECGGEEGAKVVKMLPPMVEGSKGRERMDGFSFFPIYLFGSLLAFPFLQICPPKFIFPSNKNVDCLGWHNFFCFHY